MQFHLNSSNKSSVLAVFLFLLIIKVKNSFFGGMIITLLHEIRFVDQKSRSLSGIYEAITDPDTPWLYDSVYHMDGIRQIHQTILWATFALPHEHSPKTVGSFENRQ